jgi:hypothetical protein
MYQLSKNLMGEVNSVRRLTDNAVIPFDPNNTDYQTFKKDLAEGASLKDAEGNDMTAEQITSFLGTLNG